MIQVKLILCMLLKDLLLLCSLIPRVVFEVSVRPSRLMSLRPVIISLVLVSSHPPSQREMR